MLESERSVVDQAVYANQWGLLSPQEINILKTCYGQNLKQHPAIQALSREYHFHTDRLTPEPYEEQIKAYPLLNRSQERFLFQQKQINPANIDALLDRTVTQGFDKENLIKLWNVYVECQDNTLREAFWLMNLRIGCFCCWKIRSFQFATA